MKTPNQENLSIKELIEFYEKALDVEMEIFRACELTKFEEQRTLTKMLCFKNFIDRLKHKIKDE